MSKNAIEILTDDHERLRDLLMQLTETTGRAAKSRSDLLKKVEAEIFAHTRVEEEIFYPAFKDADGKEHEKMFFEAKEEHRTVEKLVLPDLLKTDPRSEEFSGRAKVLRELIEHHAEEEESEMFPMAENSFSGEELNALGDRIAARKKELNS